MSEPFDHKDNEFVAWYPVDLTSEASADVWRHRPAAYYVHIPFCTAICDYCGFAITRLKEANVERYLAALKTEIERYAASGRLANYEFICGHFGGGTPSAISADALADVKSLLDRSFGVTADAEVTIEVNPISFTLAKAEQYREMGINRVSVGIQSFDDETLSIIGRPHKTADVANALNVVSQVGWANYSIDLIYGVPGQTTTRLKEDLAKAIDSGATHISCFRLEIIPLTALKLREAAYLLPARLSVDALNMMDDVVWDTLTTNGYNGYGAFNFAKPGFESVHNSIAFVAPQSEYIGFGNSSHSYCNGFAFCNVADIDDYCDAVFAGRDPIAYAARVDALEKMSRFFVLGLKFFHVSRQRFIQEFGLEPEAVFGEVIRDLSDKELLFRDADRYVLTPLGRRYVNNVVKAFYVGDSRGKRQCRQFVANLTMNQVAHYVSLRERAEMRVGSK